MANEEPKFELVLTAGEFNLRGYTAWFLFTGPVTPARDNPPWILRFPRRSEVMVPVSGGL